MSKDGKAWCSTKVSKNGWHIGGRGNWGHCPAKGCSSQGGIDGSSRLGGKEGTCKTVSGPGANKPCVFPFYLVEDEIIGSIAV